MFIIMIAYSWFWFVGGIVLTAINSFGRFQLGLNNFDTSLLVAVTSIGIAVGSAVVGRMSKGKIRIRLIVPGMILLTVCLLSFFVIPVHSPTQAELDLLNTLKNVSQENLLSSTIIPEAGQNIRIAAFVSLFLLGTASGFFSVPLLTFIQARPPAHDKGKVFAAVNWLNWIFIVASAIVYGIGISLSQNQAHYLLGFLGVFNAIAGLLLLPGIFRIIRQERPSIVLIEPENKTTET